MSALALQFPLAAADQLAADMAELVSKMKAENPTKQ
jgi:hypothetical protein